MADTRTRSQRIDGDAEVQDLAPVDLDASAQRLDTFPELLQALNAVPDSARPDIAARLNDVLIAMRAPGHESEEAELVMEALSSKELHDAIDSRGRSCRKEAVQTMMACGFPHALMLDPDDMAFARSFVEVRKAPSATGSSENTIDDDHLEPWESGMRGNRRLGAAVMSALQIFSAILSLIKVPSAMALAAVGLSFVGLFAASSLAFSRPRDFNIATFGAFATMLALVGFVVALAAQSWVIAIAPAGVAAGLYISIAMLYQERADRPQPGDWDYEADQIRRNW